MITEPKYVERINSLGQSALEAFLESPTIGNFMRQSRIFWEGVGIADDRTMSMMRLFERAGIASPSAKKGLVFGIVSEDELHSVVKKLSPSSPRLEGEPPFVIEEGTERIKIIISEIAQGGAC
jgi:pantoate kinase